jgi:hypothetical protein
MRFRGFSLLGALLLSGLLTTTAFAAAPPGKVTIESDGCSFRVLIDLEQAYDVVGWKVKEYNAANWNEGLTLFKGSGPSDPNGDMVVGPFTAPEGHYNVAVDNEYPPDGSSIVVDFTLSCPAAGAPAPTPGGNEQPAPTPGGNEQPAAGTPPPKGTELGASGTGGVRAVTPPPTNTVAARTDAGNGDRLVVLALIGLLAGSVLVMTIARPARVGARSADPRRSR